MVVANLFARIGAKADTSGVDKMSHSLGDVKTSFIKVIGLATLTTAAISKLAGGAMNAAVAFAQFEAETGSSAQELQKWQGVAEQTNSSTESITAAIKTLSAEREKIKLGQGNISGYQLLGIDPNQDPFKILEDLRGSIKGLEPAMKRTALSQLGLSGELLKTLNLTREQFDAMAERSYIIPPETLKQITEVQKAFSMTRRAAEFMRAKVVAEFGPQLITVARHLTRFVEAIGNSVLLVKDLAEATIGLKGAMAVLGGVLVAMNSALLLSPITWITLGIIALIAVMDDLYTYFQGGDSLFGMLVDKLEPLRAKLAPIKDFFQGIADAMDRIANSKAVKFFTDGNKEVSLAGGGLAGLGGTKALQALQGHVQGGSSRSWNSEVNIEVKTNDPETAAGLTADSVRRELNSAAAQRRTDE